MYRLPPTGKEFTDQQHLAGPLSTVFNLEILKLFFFFFNPEKKNRNDLKSRKGLI